MLTRKILKTAPLALLLASTSVHAQVAWTVSETDGRVAIRDESGERPARRGAKIAAGAEFTFCQPVYETELMTRFLESTADLPEIPFFVGILPLASLKNAEFLTREVPGMAVPDSVLSRLRDCKTRDEQREVGIRVAADNLAVAMDHPRVKGAYIFPPFGRYEAILRVLKESGARD